MSEPDSTKGTLTGDPVIEGCLRRISRVNVAAMYVLRDYLLETGHPLAEEIDGIVTCHHYLVVNYLGGSWKPRRGWWNVAREIGVSHLAATREIARAFGKRWRLVYGWAWIKRQRRGVPRYRTVWAARVIDASYDRNHAWLRGVRATITAAAS
jgi:hypothetical protein